MNHTSLSPKTHLSMAAEFNMSPRLFSSKIKQLNIPNGDIMPKHQKMIYELLGYTSKAKREWYADV